MSTALARRQGETPAVLAQIQAASGRLAASLPRHFSPEKMIQLFSVMVYKTPKLQECVPESIVTALIQAGSLDLDLNPGMMEAFLIPRWNSDVKAYEAQFQPGYKGLEKLAVRTGTVLYIQPREVCEADGFEVEYDPDLKLRHKPAFGAKRGRITHVYALAKLANGDRLIEVMDADEIEGIHARSESARAARKYNKAEFGPWASDWKEMALKTVVKRMCKRLPRGGSPEQAAAFEALNRAIEADDRQYEDWREEPAEHLAINHDNGTGHGSGAYAPPEVQAEYKAWQAEFVSRWNQKWLDNWTDHDGVDPRVKDLLSTWQVSGHLVKWGAVNGHLNAPDSPKQRQKDPFAAVLWAKCRKDMKAEADRYARQEWGKAYQKLAPPAPEDETQAPAVEPEDECDPDIDLPPGDYEREPGED